MTRAQVLSTLPRTDVRSFGAVGDGVADDSAAFASAIAVGGRITGSKADTYRIASGITIAKDDTYIDLDGGAILVDFTAGTGVTIGNASTVYQRCGIKNTRIRTEQSGTSLNGVKFTTNVRHGVQPENLIVEGFKGTGVEFQSLNWNVQSLHGLYVRDCGVNLKVGANSNAMNLYDCTLLDATTYNIDLDGVSSFNVYGGIIQGAGTAGVRVENTTAACYGVGFWGTYFEDNGANHVLADGANGITVAGCFIQCNGMTGDALTFTNCDGITILPNSPVNVSANNLINCDANCTRVTVYPQAVTAGTDEAYTGTTNILSGFATRVVDTAALAAPGVLALGTMKRHRASGDRDVVYVATQTASGTLDWLPVGFGPRVSTNATATGSLAVNIYAYNTFEWTLTGNITVGAPGGDKVNGESVTFLLKQDGTGGYTVTWNAAYVTDYSDTGNTANKTAAVTFQYSASLAKWVQVGKLAWA